MDRDGRILADVLREIHQVASAPGNIHVEVKDGVVTLSGLTDNFADQMACEEAARKMPEVAGVVQNIELRLPPKSKEENLEIARRCANALDLNRYVPHERLDVIVKDGCVFLKGEVDSASERQEAESTIRKIPGVNSVTNEIVVKPGLKPKDIYEEIRKAFLRMVEYHARYIKVEIEGEKLTLSGVARAWVEIVEAERIAREMPGIKDVVNNITLTPLLQGKEHPPGPADHQRLLAERNERDITFT